MIKLSILCILAASPTSNWVGETTVWYVESFVGVDQAGALLDRRLRKDRLVRTSTTGSEGPSAEALEARKRLDWAAPETEKRIAGGSKGVAMDVPRRTASSSC